MTGHAEAVGSGPWLVVALALAYDALALRVPGWNRWRAAAFQAGCVALIIGLALPAHDFTGHMAQHLLIAMVAPLGLVVGTPVTLLLRTLPVPVARRLTAVMRSRPVRIITHPIAALLLTVGGLPLLTVPQAMAHPLVTVHFLLAGCLFAWVIAGADPAPHRASVTARLVTLGVAIAAHAAFSQYLYATAPGPDQQAGATLMYYGGDLAELLLAFAVVQSRTTRTSRATATRQGPLPQPTPVHR
ncbi:cytochrome c oxidase assembly protein [Actinoplanes xinjiangensis]|uniref:Putative membrane protein n=1 Tax=Actinoplanes xinjiangensis TaxID=512350 RepID=A0A316EJW0_9ACTN|nr:cytochrome c oxidase assembly protein [Actinoplanes xinjiangensis]PWK30180.1 putative membrane protein [Actinoplanes xinjiangensis]GIF44608.1 hypothetical protein Axi01nite_89190 [Actinoplanes xinjiangensis]